MNKATVKLNNEQILTETRCLQVVVNVGHVATVVESRLVRFLGLYYSPLRVEHVCQVAPG